MSFHKTLTRIRRWIAVQKTIHELESLDDRELDDLGIGRWNIPELARRGAR